MIVTPHTDDGLLVIGGSGQLGRALHRLAPDATFLGREQLDLTAPITELPEATGVIIAAAYTAVDAAESDEATARRVNAGAVAEIGAICAARDIPVVHVSTDYVFSGQADTPWTPDAPIDPLNSYGRTKAQGEAALMASGARAAILRTSWVFDGTGRNFLTTMLRLGQTRDSLSVVDDQLGRPTYAGHLAEACLAALSGLQSGAAPGIHHATNGGDPVSWAGFARAIFTAARLNVKVEPIPTSAFPTPAARPAYSVLDTSSFTKVFGLTLPHWRAGLAAAIIERHAAAPNG